MALPNRPPGKESEEEEEEGGRRKRGEGEQTPKPAHVRQLNKSLPSSKTDMVRRKMEDFLAANDGKRKKSGGGRQQAGN